MKKIIKMRKQNYATGKIIRLLGYFIHILWQFIFKANNACK